MDMTKGERYTLNVESRYNVLKTLQPARDAKAGNTHQHAEQKGH